MSALSRGLQRVDLPDGQWATLRERLTYAQGRAVRLALIQSKDTAGNVLPGMVDLDLVLLDAYVSAWSVKDLDGADVPLGTWDQAPDDVIQAISIAAMTAWKARVNVPKDTAAPSPTSPRARRRKS